MAVVNEIYDKDIKQEISLKIMHAIPKWFNPPEDIDKKSIVHRDYPFFAVYDNDSAVGFLTLKIHNEFTADIFNMGVLEEYHGNGFGTALVRAAEKYCVENNFKFLTVKTLDGSVNYEPYERTRSFYAKMGFIPLEVFKTFWDEDNPCLFLAKYIG